VSEELGCNAQECAKNGEKGAMTDSATCTALGAALDADPCYVALTREDYDKSIDAILAALAAAGFKVLAREPSNAMLENAIEMGDYHLFDALWRTMWDAAP
jgi:hypothetical protein